MTHSTKTAALVFALAALAGPVVAQTTPASPAQGQSRSPASSGAAATLPNTFDGPATQAQAATPPAPVADAEVAEAALRSVIEQLRAAEIDEALFTPGVATQLNGQLAEYSRLIRGYGAVQSVETQGAGDGVGQFLVLFENAATQWQIGLNEAGLIAAVRFREAPPESSEEPAPGA